MPDSPNVLLNKKAHYWVAVFYDRAGHRKMKRIGIRKGTAEAKKTGRRKNALPVLSKQQAERKVQQMAVELNENCEVLNTTSSPTLKSYLDRYQKMRAAELKPATLKSIDMTCRYLLQHFGPAMRLNQITVADARNWKLALAEGRLDAARDPDGKAGGFRKVRGERKSEATIRLNIRNAKAVFNWAVEEELIGKSPFAKFTGRSPAPPHDWHFVTRDEFRELLTGCSNIGWRVFLAMQRLGGLRRQEAYDLRLEHVDIERRQLEVINEKTRTTARKVSRFVPMNDELEAIVLEAINDLEPGEEYLVSRRHVGANNWTTRIQEAAKRAGVKLWASPFHVLRKSRATELAEGGVPMHVHCDVFGHGEAVASAFYIKVRTELREKCSQI